LANLALSDTVVLAEGCLAVMAAFAPCTGVRSVTNEVQWGQYDQCDMGILHDWLKRARSNCITGANVCTDPPIIQYHQYLDYLHPKVWEGDLLSFKVFLMTQVCRTQWASGGLCISQ
jgi:hypothetical protein